MTIVHLQLATRAATGIRRFGPLAGSRASQRNDGQHRVVPVIAVPAELVSTYILTRWGCLGDLPTPHLNFLPFHFCFPGCFGVLPTPNRIKVIKFAIFQNLGSGCEVSVEMQTGVKPGRDRTILCFPF